MFAASRRAEWRPAVIDRECATALSAAGIATGADPAYFIGSEVAAGGSQSGLGYVLNNMTLAPLRFAHYLQRRPRALQAADEAATGVISPRATVAARRSRIAVASRGSRFVSAMT